MQPDSEKQNQDENNAKTESNIENIEELKKALAEEKDRADSNLASWQRAQADFTNYKRFIEKDKAESLKYANASLLSGILPILDDFERALASVPPEEQSNKWVEGLKMIDRKFRDILQKQGVVPIQALGMEFDPCTMDAISVGPGRKDTVIMEVERGYKIQDKVIRPAKVVVGNGEEQVDKEE